MNTAATPVKAGGSGILTARQIEAASLAAKRSGKDEWLADPAPRGAGRLTIRCTPGGARMCMYRFTMRNGARDILSLGPYDPLGAKGLDLSEARQKAGELARLRQSGVDDLRAHLAGEQAEAERQKRAAAGRGTLAELIDAYVKHLGERPSAKDAGNMLRLHVKEAWPAIAATAAADVRPEQLRDVLARLIEAGKGRSAQKVRSFIRAAYSLGLRADLDPSIPGTFANFAVIANPVERLPSLAQYSRAADRVLTDKELRTLWKRLNALPENAARDVVIASMLAGGQRPTQVARLRVMDIDTAAGTIMLFDPKGRGRSAAPRRHVVPVCAELAALLKRRSANLSNGEAWVFASGDGETHTREESASALVADIRRAMEAAGELERGHFALRDLRRSAETVLASLGVAVHVRAQLLSHGLGGIQQRHYDRHDYLTEKADAIRLWVDHLQGPKAPAKRARKAKA